MSLSVPSVPAGVEGKEEGVGGEGLRRVLLLLKYRFVRPKSNS